MAHVSSDYSNRLLAALRQRSEPSEKPRPAAQLAELTGYSYEHCRKALAGQPVVSREFNARVAEVLQLNADDLWQDAMRQKAGAYFEGRLDAEPDVARMWALLEPSDQKMLVRMMRGLLALRRQTFK